MNAFEEIKAILRGKDGKKLAVFSLAVFLVIAAIVFFAFFQLSESVHIKLMNEYLDELPKIIGSRRNERQVRGHVYEEDIMSRAELGLKIYADDNALTNSEKLERTRENVSAASVSLLDGQGDILFTTGPESPEDKFRDYVKTLESRSPHIELYQVVSEDSRNDGKGFVRLPVPGSADRSLVFEFPCSAVLELYNALSDWSSLLERMLSGGDAFAFAFAKTGGKITGYPLNGFTSEETPRLYEELEKVFQNAGRFKRAENGRRTRLIKLLGNYYLAVLMNYPQENADILLTVPLEKIVVNAIFIASSISAVIGFGIVLLLIYIFRCLVRKKPGKDSDSLSFKSVLSLTWPGILAVLAVTFLFSDMLLLLDIRTTATFTAVTKRMSLQYEIDYHKGQENKIRANFTDFYRKRAQMIADFLTAHPDYLTRTGLKELNRIAKTDYLMLFDRSGNERISSNSYTGFSVSANMKDYQSVLMGYPYAVAGPEADPYTGKMQLGAAILMTDREGLPDGFLLAVYSAGNLNAELERMSYENVVDGFAVREGHTAAAISAEDGRFIAHTDKNIIGQKAVKLLENFESETDFEGFTYYDGDRVCISASTSGGKTLVFIVPKRADFYIHVNFILLSLAVLLILAVLYYPAAAVLLSRAVNNSQAKWNPHAESAVAIFSDGYSAFLTPFAIIALISSYNRWWTSFNYVFTGDWSKGVNLFSLWAALFIAAVTLFCKFLIRKALSSLEKHISLSGKTIIRLANSLTAYAANIFLIFFILDMFGVNTAALLASAGVISIAVGMGAQSMAADLLAGFFMMLEGSVHVGDYVSVSGVKGHVTDMGIRTTEITDDEGNVVILNNSHVNAVCNMSRKNSQKKPENDTKENAVAVN